MRRRRIPGVVAAVGVGVALGVGGLVAPPPAHAQIRIPGVNRDRAPRVEDLNPGYDGTFQFVRLRFGDDGGGLSGFGRRGRREPPWMHDYPTAERNFLQILNETTFIDLTVDASNIMAVDDPELFKHPVAYIVEVGFWNPTDGEAEALGEYLDKGGFLIVDDFRDQWGEWDNFVHQMSRVLPGRDLIQLDGTHEIFDSFFRIENPERFQPPTFRGYPPLYYGVFEDNDPEKRLMLIANFNNDIGDYWEYSDRGYYPIDLSNDAYKLGVNYVIYSLTH